MRDITWVNPRLRVILIRYTYFLCSVLATLVFGLFSSALLYAQQSVSQPERKVLFKEDTDPAKVAAEVRRKKILAITKEDSPQVDVKAKSMEFLREPQRARGSGGVIVSKGGVAVQADDATVNMDTKDSDLDGHILITGMGSELGAKKGEFNLESETGTFRQGEVAMDQGAYHFQGETVHKVSEFTYQFQNSRLTTCGCSDTEDAPWHISASEVEATQDGYAEAYDATFKMYDIPFFYTPYISFPVKNERASGLLVPSFGISRQDGFTFMQPIFGVIDDSTDVMLTPFIATKSRVGSKIDFRKNFSNNNKIDTRWIYSDESWRGNDLRGSNVDGLDTTGGLIDTNRFGGYYSQGWKGDKEDAVPWSMNADVHYVSDNLFLREIQDPAIGNYNDRYVTSTVALSSSLSDYVNAAVTGEYNQAMVDQQDEVLQRLPTLAVGGQKSFRPFGFNPYGVKLGTSMNVTSVDFYREDGYYGWRHNVNPTLSVPFHYKNYFDSTLSATTHQTFYDMNNNIDPDTNEDFDYNTQRSVFQFSYQTQTALERVYDLDPGNSLTYLTSMGSQSQVYRLERVKHTIEPFVNYSYVPEEYQEDNPEYDTFDRINKRSLFTYGFRTSLIGRFLPPGGVGDKEIPELTPRVQDLPIFSPSAGLPEFGNDRVFGPVGNISSRLGEIREILYMTFKQSYDRIEALEDTDPGRDALSDLYSEIGLYPTNYFGFVMRSNYDVQNPSPSSWDVGTHFRDDRGDSFILRYGYNSGPQGQAEPSINQYEGNLEVVLSEQLKFGYYGLYDDIENEFQVNRFALRFSDSCKCWYLDFGMMEQLNPERQFATVSLTLFGLGALNQKFGLNDAGAGGDQ